MLSDFVLFSIFPIFSSEIPLDVHESIGVVVLKYVIYFLTGINTK